MICRNYLKYNVLPVRVCWFNINNHPDMIPIGINRFRQSVKIENSLNHYKIRETIFTTLLIDLETSERQLWHNLHKSHRNEINKIRHKLDIGENVRFKINYNLDDFIQLANSHIKLTNYRNKLSYSDLDDYLKYNKAELLSTYANGRLMAAHLYLLDNPERVRVLFGYNARNFCNEDRNFCSYHMKYLHWHAIIHYKARGFKWLDFGGINLDPNAATFGIARFKSGFGGIIKREYDYEFASNRFLMRLYPRFTYKKEFRNLDVK